MVNPPRDTLVLGLDLQGGIHLVMRVHTEDAVRVLTDETAEQFAEQLDNEEIDFADIETVALGRLIILNLDDARLREVRDIVAFSWPGWDLRAAGNGDWSFTLRPSEEILVREQTVIQAMETIRRRVDELGVAEPVITTHGNTGDQILVQLPGYEDVARAKEIIQATAQLELRLVQAGPALDEAALPPLNSALHNIPTELPTGATGYYQVNRVAAITGRDLRNARQGIDFQTNTPNVEFSLHADGASRFREFTGANVGRQMAIVLDDHIVSAPVIQSPIYDQGQITGNFTVNEALDLDGALDESIYDDVPSISDFVQVEPNAGVLATEQTEAWIFFDESNVYVSARAWDSTPEANWIMNEMRRDSFNLLQNEGIGFSFDTFYDRRSSIVFNVTPLAGRMDGQVNSEGSYSPDWNPIWQLQTSRFEGGWSFEASIPFKSLRYRPGRVQIWGFQMRRDVMWKNEMSHIVPIDPGLGRGGLLEASLHPSLVGLEAPQLGNLLEIKPFVIGDLSSDFTGLPVISNQVGGNVGIDVVTYGVTENLTADFTLNTDFAQVEADEQQVNLTRFSLFFPEKREFFLENQGAFAFGTGGRRSRSGGSQDAPILFYSRRIGLNRGLEVPIRVGGRLTGRAGPYTIGLLSIQTGSEPTAEAQSTNFSVVRIRRDILRRSSIGAILTNRSMSVVSPVQGGNLAVGFDAALAFYDNLSMNAYWAKTDTAGLEGDGTSYTGDLRFATETFREYRV